LGLGLGLGPTPTPTPTPFNNLFRMNYDDLNNLL